MPILDRMTSSVLLAGVTAVTLWPASALSAERKAAEPSATRAAPQHNPEWTDRLAMPEAVSNADATETPAGECLVNLAFEHATGWQC